MRAVELYGLDMERGRLQRAQAEVKAARLVHGDIYGLPFAEGSFDKVLLSEVLEHLEHDVRALRAIGRLLKPGGLLAISVPNANYPFWWDPINRTWTGLGGEPIRRGPIVGIWTNHKRLYQASELPERLTEAGFEVETIEQSTHYCFPLMHLLVYGIGKPLLERNLLPGPMVRSADRFHGEQNRGSRLNPINLGVSVFRAVDRINERPQVASKDTFVNILVKARKA
jgi:SAM-dependent methyltransferase